jgi:DNA-directed RNA polymerase specialized sigma24 family protein
VERARQRETIKRGGGRQQVDLDVDETGTRSDEEVLALNEALENLKTHDPEGHQLVMLRYFGGLGHQEAAAAMGIGRRQADRLWAIARVWLHEQIHGNEH